MADFGEAGERWVALMPDYALSDPKTFEQLTHQSLISYLFCSSSNSKKI